MNRRDRAIAFCIVLPLSILWRASAGAEGQGSPWSAPYRLSSEAGRASEAYLAADQFGYVHAFWTETLFADEQMVLEYARFDGAAWSTPNEIYVATRGIENVSPVVDQHGTLHVAWAESEDGPGYYTQAPAYDALSVQNWAPPRRIDIPAGIIQLRVDSRATLHVVYINRGEELGVYYVRSEDYGTTWSEPAWLDPDTPLDYTPADLTFEIDENDGLHAVWDYGAISVDAAPNQAQIRYAHSLDGGHTWSVPLTIDQVIPETRHNLDAAGPVMAVVGQTVHVVWAAGQQPYRHHRFSTDAGQTWSAPRRVFGDLQGQAGDGLAIDGAGRLHFLGQIRYPIGIYHAFWDGTQWTPASLIYLVAGAGEEIGNRIHAHTTHPVVRAGNQLVLTFTDPPAEPNRRLFVMVRLLDGLEPLELFPTPAPTASPVSAPISTSLPPALTPTRTPQAPPLDSANQPSGRAGTSSATLTVLLIPALLLLAAVLAVRLLIRPRL